MDFATFLQLLEQKSLWFSRPDQFNDPLEGTYTDGEIEHFRSLNATNAVAGLPNLDGWLEGPKYMRTTAYVSCWRAGMGESLAMWDLYGKGSGIVAVKTSVGALRQAINESTHRIFLGEVKYVDWSLAPWHNNGLVMCFRKDLSYQLEAEVRAVVWDVEIINRNMSDALIAARSRADYPQAVLDPFVLEKGHGILGMEVSFDPGRFISEIVVGPREKAWVATLVDNVLERYGLNIKATVSNRLTPR
ncbi:MAG: hypothetical protein ABSF53_18655 [Terracidiphilus sp.]|jgi:hypothetical protein